MMTTLYHALCALVPELVDEDFFNGRVRLQNDGGEDYIREWKHPSPRPTEAQILAQMALPRVPTGAEIKAECARRIYAKVSDNAQRNLLANHTAGILTADEKQAFKDGTLWIRAMQATCRDLIVALDPDYANDDKWPTCPANAAALAREY